MNLDSGPLGLLIVKAIHNAYAEIRRAGLATPPIPRVLEAEPHVRAVMGLFVGDAQVWTISVDILERQILTRWLPAGLRLAGLVAVADRYEAENAAEVN